MPIFDEPALHALGALSANEQGLPAAALAAQNVTATLPARPAAAQAPAIFTVPIPGALGADVVLTAPAPHSPLQTGDYVAGDVLRFLRTDTASAHTVTINDGTSGAIAGAVMGQPTHSATIEVQLNTAGHWTFQGGGAL